VVYGCVLVDSNTLSDLYNEFSGGQLDDSSPLACCTICGKNQDRLDSCKLQCAVGEVVSALGQYVEFCVTKLETESNAITQLATGSGAEVKENAFAVLLNPKGRGAGSVMFLRNGGLKRQSTKA